VTIRSSTALDAVAQVAPALTLAVSNYRTLVCTSVVRRLPVMPAILTRSTFVMLADRYPRRYTL
jgi:hypothetical protein